MPRSWPRRWRAVAKPSMSSSSAIAAACIRSDYRFVGNQEGASDLAQDAFVRAWKGLGNSKGQSALSTWLYRIAVWPALQDLRTLLEWSMRWTATLVACVVTAVVVSANVLSPQLADAFEKKIVLVQQISNDDSSKARATTFTQDETNSYLKYKAGGLLPTGLTEPVLTMHGQGRVSGQAVVDLDVVRQKQSSGSWFDPTSYLTGRLPVTAAGRVVTADGKGRFELERAEVSGVPIPKPFLGQMVNFFTRTADNPNGSSIDDTFELPADIRRIDVEAGRFILHQ